MFFKFNCCVTYTSTDSLHCDQAASGWQLGTTQYQTPTNVPVCLIQPCQCWRSTVPISVYECCIDAIPKYRVRNLAGVKSEEFLRVDWTTVWYNVNITPAGWVFSHEDIFVRPHRARLDTLTTDTRISYFEIWTTKIFALQLQLVVFMSTIKLACFNVVIQ